MLCHDDAKDDDDDDEVEVVDSLDDVEFCGVSAIFFVRTTIVPKFWSELLSTSLSACFLLPNKALIRFVSLL